MKEFNAFKVYARALSLVVSLSLVLGVIAYLQGGSFHKFIEMKSKELGLSGEDHTQTHTKLAKSLSFRLCKSRIASLEWSNHAKIYEDKSSPKAKWMAQDFGSGEPRELDYLDVEKWLGINCMVRVIPLQAFVASQPSGLPDFLVVRFIDGSISHVKKSKISDFQFDDQFFQSGELARSLSELYRLAGIKNPEPR